MATVPMPNFPGNSNASKTVATPAPEKPKVEKVIDGTATLKKPPLMRRIAESFTGDDMRSVGNYVVLDVLVPAAKNMISDALTTAVERFFFGDGRRINRGGSSYGAYSSHTPYNRMASSAPPWRQEPQQQVPMSRRARATHDFREVLLPDRQAAGIVLDTLTDLGERYGVVTVQDFYDACGLTSEYTDNKWGWTSLVDASIQRVREGYIIQLPPPSPLN